MNPPKITAIHPDGTRTEHAATGKKWRLAEVQALIGGGYLEVVGKTTGGALVGDEEGQLKKQPFNEQASALAGRILVGTILICPKGTL